MRVGALQLVLACLVAVVIGSWAVPAARAVTPRIVGGSVVTIQQHPWQVAIVRKNQIDPGPPVSAVAAMFCGGVLIDAKHVVTAAHCLDYDENGSVDPVISRQVVVGASDLGDLGGPPPVDIESWGEMPDYDPDVGSNDVAVATLASAVDVSSANVKPAALVAAGEPTPQGTPLVVSGYGQASTNGPVSPLLQAVGVFAVGDPLCEGYYAASGFNRPTMICAIAPGRDSCYGDSGGPLTLPDGLLVGLVSGGATECASPDGAPGIYAELANPEIATYIRTLTPEYAPPASSAPPSLVGLAKSGDTLTCLPGTWTSTAGTPDLDYLFRTPEGAVLRDWSASPAFTPGDDDGGRRVVCVERARDATGAAMAASAPSDEVIGPPAPTPNPGPPPAPTPLAPRDVVAPRTAFVSVRCSKRTCRVRIRATDAGNPVSGVRDVRVTVLPGRGRARTITAKSLGRGLYEARFTKLRRGTTWFTASARDRAGNLPATLAIRRAAVR